MHELARPLSTLLVHGLLCVGCVPDPSSAPDGAEATDGAPFDLEAWTDAPDAADPFPTHAPEDRGCVGMSTLEGVVEVSTSDCPYLLVQQAAASALVAGTRLRGGLVTDARTAAEPAEAHAALSLDGSILFEATLPIPGPAAFERLDLTLEEDVPVGAALVLHLHNHGSNHYRFLDLEVTPPE